MNVIVLDTETTNTLEEPIAYDLGWIVLNLETGEILSKHSFAIAEIFLDNDLMKEAFFAEKIPTYWEDIKNGKRVLAKLSTIFFTFKNDCKNFHISEVYAHNMKFDDLSLRLTQRFITNSKYRYFLPYGVVVKDTLKYSRHILKGNKTYTEFCEINNYKTTKNSNKFTAEVLYRFISGENTFEEVHQGLDDVMIEKEILLYCFSKDSEYDASLW